MKKPRTSVIWTLVIIGLPLLLLFAGVPGMFSRLLTGWYRHLVGAAPLLAPEWQNAVGLVSLLVVTLVALHLVLRRFRSNQVEGHRPWPLSRTMLLMGMALILFATTCASIGILHHSVWFLFGGRVTHDVSIGIVTKAISNARQLSVAVRI